MVSNHRKVCLMLCTWVICSASEPVFKEKTLEVDGTCETPQNSLELKVHALRKLYHVYASQIAHVLRPGLNRDTPNLRAFETKIGDASRCPFKSMAKWAVHDESSSNKTDFSTAHYSCPWYIDADFDISREPSILYQVKCSCDQCIEKTGKKCEKDGTGCLHFTGICAPILKPFPVIRRRCITGSRYFEYEGVFEFISVGCTCTRSQVLIPHLQ